MHKFVVLLLLISISTLTINGQHTSKNDSISRLLKRELEKSKELTSIANYPEAYDTVWNVLITADSIQDSTIKYQAYQRLSVLYSIFNKKEEAISAIDSVFHYVKDLKEYQDLKIRSSIYYSAALTYRMNNKYVKAKEFLKISEQLLDSLQVSIPNKIYIYTEKAHLQTLTGNLIEAERLLNNISQQITPQHEYASIVYSMLGDLYLQKEDKNKAFFFFNKSLKNISEQKTRLGLRVGLLSKVSKINEQLGNYKLAYQQINESKILSDSLFGSKSDRNNRLFEIKDSYRKSIIENNKIKKEQELKLIKAQKEKLNLQLLFSIILIGFIILGAFLGVRLLRKKHAVEKKLAIERINSEIEIKKKELAVTALQLIEKDKVLAEIKKGLNDVKKHKDDDAVEKIKRTIKVSSLKTWKEFETRFIQVNSSFYESLGKKHSNLSRNELKLCALIKLNFSTKEMSQLLGVSTDTVNKARYRLRKKLELQREDNLFTYISSIN
ncbi:hypothetical protein [Polaribacter sp. SA4-12]|uniref:hypothetical protein n=1 Tax=Polaribacter sp. SA4-12 TaxID=1312072 RepID=UPI000B3C7F4B|nr:hypothetical protein [Polaribacter sp. SA4-12]ARV15904.1 hypothetical protein BTO07_12460 [Polaribacter sp. SA4-12]